ncbi:MAG: hypothetical protein ACXIUZ_00605 [Lysobacteraceae bacterium]
MSILLSTLLALSSVVPHSEGGLGPITRPFGVEACEAYLDSFPADRVRVARVNGHQAIFLREHSGEWPWLVDVQDVKRWCRYGYNRIRVDLWVEHDPDAEPVDPQALLAFFQSTW